MTRLEQIAEKFGKVPKELRKKEQVVPAYLTEEEFSLLPQCPRTGTMQSAGTWVKIGGRQTYPMTGALTKEERQQYYALKGTGSGGSRSTSVIQGASEEEIKKYNEVFEELLKLNPPKKLKEYFEALRPKTKEELELRKTLENQGFTKEQIEMVVAMQQKNKKSN